MRVCLLIDIDDNSLMKQNMSRDIILDKTLDRIAELYNSLGVSFDCGYNPNEITDSEIN